MNRKSNPLVALVALVLLVVLVVCTCTGCTDVTEAEEPPRFKVERMTNDTHRFNTYIITDTETGVQYLYIGGDRQGGITKLEEGNQ